MLLMGVMMRVGEIRIHLRRGEHRPVLIVRSERLEVLLLLVRERLPRRIRLVRRHDVGER